MRVPYDSLLLLIFVGQPHRLPREMVAGEPALQFRRSICAATERRDYSAVLQLARESVRLSA
jgi:hypothetical protein